MQTALRATSRIMSVPKLRVGYVPEVGSGSFHWVGCELRFYDHDPAFLHAYLMARRERLGNRATQLSQYVHLRFTKTYADGILCTVGGTGQMIQALKEDKIDVVRLAKAQPTMKYRDVLTLALTGCRLDRIPDCRNRPTSCRLSHRWSICLVSVKLVRTDSYVHRPRSS
jgi:hypothetical protein